MYQSQWCQSKPLLFCVLEAGKQNPELKKKKKNTYIEGRISFIDEQTHTLPFIIFTFLKVYFHSFVLCFTIFIFHSISSLWKRQEKGREYLLWKVAIVFQGKTKNTSSQYAGRLMQKSMLIKGSSFLLLVVLEDGSYTPEVAERKIWV